MKTYSIAPHLPFSVGATLGLEQCTIAIRPDMHFCLLVRGGWNGKLREVAIEEEVTEALYHAGKLEDGIVKLFYDKYPDMKPTEIPVDVAQATQQVKDGRRIVARQEHRAVLLAYKLGQLNEDQVISAVEIMVNGAVADCRAYHRIPEPGAPELPMQPMPLGAHEPPQMPKIVGDWPADET